VAALKEKISIAPKLENIFKAFEYCSFQKTKVVIFGQDPYFQPGVANGLAFSVNKDQAIPSSLRNIYKEIKNDLGVVSNFDGDLRTWSRQGVLLLNSALTVEDHKPGSHSDIGWNDFIFDVIDSLNKKGKVVFMLWGNNAKKYLDRIDNANLVLTTSHPSPLSAYRGFFGCKHFSKCNKYLKQNNRKLIDW
jgi:uracil-DNA glycosylase